MVLNMTADLSKKGSPIGTQLHLQVLMRGVNLDPCLADLSCTYISYTRLRWTSQSQFGYL